MASEPVPLNGLARRLVEENIIPTDTALNASEEANKNGVPFVSYLVQNGHAEARTIAASAAGVQVCELLPMMSRLAHRYAIIRSTYHKSGLHGAGVHYNMTGMDYLPRKGEPQVSRLDPPCIGGAVRQLRGDRNV